MEELGTFDELEKLYFNSGSATKKKIIDMTSR
jgi:hypothetical protein